jgi:uncharacterized protein YndB with AHSA1/START domain
MPGGNPHAAPGFDHALIIRAAPARVMAAFFDPDALAIWWQAVRSVTIARAFGVYAIEWRPTEFRDELLGPLGGVFHGTVVDVKPGQEFFVADAWWVPPEGQPIGPMGLDVTCAREGPACRLHVRQYGYEDSARWQRYYEVVDAGWRTSLAALKKYLEGPHA